MPDLRDRLAELEARGLRRRLAPPRGVDLSSNDVLGLSRHPEVRAALHAALEAGLPHGGGASRLLTGQHDAWADLEARFAAWQHAEASLYFNTGYAANTGLLQALVAPGDLVVSDALNHASLVDGLRLTRAERAIVPHADVGAVARVLTEHPGRTAWIVVESVYSMDGDSPDLVALADLAQAHGALLIVDEAHATGLYGPEGQGRVVELGLRDRVAASVHTAGKALGSQGAFVVGSSALVDWLVNRARPFIYSTAPPPFLAAGLQAAVALVEADPALRARPRQLADQLRAALPGVDTAGSSSHIVPVVVGTAAAALALATRLQDKGWDARAIRPPTVPEGTCRVRLVLRAGLTEGDVAQLARDVLESLP